ncbi:MAG: Clp protease N-terminal domain-containing protein [Mucilaginibacter sp.]
METAYFSDIVNDVLRTTGKLAVASKCDHIDSEHILLAIIDESLKNADKNCITIKVFKLLNINLFELIEDIESAFDKTENLAVSDKLPFSKKAEMILKHSFIEAKIYHSIFIDIEHVLLAYLRRDSLFLEKTLIPKYNLTYKRVKESIAKLT